jgi:8-amino-7-oxononanoate synthase
VLLASSLAKGFGVPLAVLAGEGPAIAAFEEESETRVYTSPPSTALIRAAERALAENRSRGEDLRRRLAGNVAYFRGLLRRFGLAAAAPPSRCRPSPGSPAPRRARCTPVSSSSTSARC